MDPYAFVHSLLVFLHCIQDVINVRHENNYAIDSYFLSLEIEFYELQNVETV